MNELRPITRRRALTLVGASGVAVLGSHMLTGCGDKELTCTDTTGLTPQQVQQRQTLGYVDRSTDPVKNCANCNFFQEATGENRCGGCQIMPGPVHPEGNCTSWAEKPPA